MRERILLGLALVCCLAPWEARAQGVALNPQAPSQYTVQKGDTLWGISSVFLDEPWRWPEVWQANPQIANPHLIYPGDEIRVLYQDGQPRLQVQRAGEPAPGPGASGEPSREIDDSAATFDSGDRVARGPKTLKLSPRVRVEPLDSAIPTIPIDVIHPFLSRPGVMTEDEFERLPHIVATHREALLARPGEEFFVRGIQDDEFARYLVYRRGEMYVDSSGEVLGLEALHVGDAVLEGSGDPSTLTLTNIEREVMVGDRLVPVLDEEIDRHFFPRPPDQPLTGEIISIIEGLDQVGIHDVVVLNLGTRDGVQAGTVMAIYQSGGEIVDTVGTRRPPGMTTEEGIARSRGPFKPHGWRMVPLPDLRAGTLMVFRPFERVSYALVMDATRSIHLSDIVRNP